MKFYLTRTSLWSDEKPLEDSRVQFDSRENAWYIELNTLEELVSFADNVNDDIILKFLGKETDTDGKEINQLSIEIYDTWRE